MSLASPIASRFSRRVTSGQVLAPSIPSQALVLQSALRSQRIGLNGVIVDESPGLGTVRPEQPGIRVHLNGGSTKAAVAISSTGTAWTMAMWVKSAQSDNLRYLFDQTTTRVILGWNDSDANEIGFYDGSWNTFGATPNDDKWHHLAWVFDGTIAKLYVDGIQLGATIAYTGAALTSTSAQELFGSPGSTNSTYEGDACDIQFFDFAVSETQAYQLATLGESALAGVDRLCWLKCDSVHSTHLLDSSGNGKNGTLTGHDDSLWATGSDTPVCYPNKVGGSAIQNLVSGSNLLGNSAYWQRLALGIPPTLQYTMANGVGLYNTTPDTGGSYSGHGRSLYFDNTKTYTISFFAKAATYGRFSIGDGSSGQFAGWWDLDTLTVDADGISGYPGTYRIEETDEAGVYRCIAEGVQISTSGNKTIYISSMDGSDLPAIYGNNNVGDGTSGGWIGGVQVTETDTAQPYAHSGLIIRKGYTPRDESNKAYDVFGTPLQYTGKAPKNMQMEQSNAPQFDGADDHAVVTTNPVTGKSAITVAARVDSATLGSEGIVGDYNGIGNAGVLLYTNRGAGNVYYWRVDRSDDSYAQVLSTTTVDSGPHDVVGTWDGASVKLYIDGVLEAEDALVGGIIGSTTSGLAIGAYRDTGSASFNGQIYDVRINDAAWTTEKVADYTATGGKDLPCTDWWPMAEGAGDKFTNVKNPANPLAIVGYSEAAFNDVKQDRFAFNAAMGCSRRMNSAKNSMGISGGNLVNNQLILSRVADPWGGNLATRMRANAVTYGQYRFYTTGNQVAVGQYFVVYFKRVAAGQAFGMIFSGTSGTTGYAFDSEIVYTGIGNSLVYNELYGTDGWRKMVWNMGAVGTNVCQIYPAISTAHTPASTDDGVDFLYGFVNDWETEDIYPTEGSEIEDYAVMVPALQDGSGNDATGLPVMYPASPGVWPHSEATLNSNPSNAPRRDWKIGDTLFTTMHGANGNRDHDFSSPDGSTNAEKFTAYLSGQTRVYSSLDAWEDGDVLTLQACVKESNTDIIGLGVRNDNSFYRALFNLDTETTDIATSGGGYITSTKMLKLPDGWFYIEATFTMTAPGATLQGFLAGGAGFITVNGDNFQWWGFKCEKGATATPYQYPNYDPNEPSDFTPNPPELVTAPEDLTNASWVDYRTNITANYDGVADRMIATSVQGTHARGETVQTIIGKTYILSVEAKADTEGWIMLNPGSPNAGFYFDLVNGVTGALYSGSPSYPDEVFIEDIGDGYYRCNLVLTATAVTMKCEFYIARDGNDLTFEGDDVGGILIKKASLKRHWPTNPNFFRTRTRDGKDVGMDRFANYKQPLVGSRLSQAQIFTAEKAL